MNRRKTAAIACFVAAIAVAAVGFVATAQLIALYGENVGLMQLALQPAILWAPIAGTLAVLGTRLYRRS